MTARLRAILALLLLVAHSGCHPTQPFYLHEDGDLSSYLDKSTSLSVPDVDEPSLAEVEYAQAPITLSDPEHREIHDVSLEEVVAISMQNSKVIRNLGSVTPFGFADALTGRTASSTTIYDPAIFETDSQNGVEAALSNFDAQLTSSLFWQKSDRPQNVTANPGIVPSPILIQDNAQFDFEISKFTAPGTTFAVRNQTIYTQNNQNFRAVPSDWFTAFELEAVHPLLRGGGTQINRIPVMLARINTDISLATFEASVRNLLLDIENTYWDLHCAYRNLEAARVSRDSARATWKLIADKEQIKESSQAEAQAKEQYFFFRSQLQTAWRDLLNVENQLRWLMGLAPTDGRILRPSDEPSKARVEFAWHDAQVEALFRSPELRQQKWAIKRRELDLIAAKNQLLPQLNVSATYRWLGVGDDLLQSRRRGQNFVTNPVGSLAFDELTEGRFQEWRMGVDFTPPRIGSRRELSGVANARLNLIREKERLKDMELNSLHLLTTALRNLDYQWELAQSQFNRWAAAEEEVRSHEVLYEGGKTELNFLLDAQRRRSQAQVDYYRAQCDYSKALAEVHFRKGSLVEHNGIMLAEGPWPHKAYWDALERARERDASTYMNYGWTRPAVISRGPVPAGQVESSGLPPASDSSPAGAGIEEIQPGQPQPAAPAGPDAELPDAGLPPGDRTSQQSAPGAVQPASFLRASGLQVPAAQPDGAGAEP